MNVIRKVASSTVTYSKHGITLQDGCGR